MGPFFCSSFWVFSGYDNERHGLFLGECNCPSFIFSLSFFDYADRRTATRTKPCPLFSWVIGPTGLASEYTAWHFLAHRRRPHLCPLRVAFFFFLFLSSFLLHVLEFWNFLLFGPLISGLGNHFCFVKGKGSRHATWCCMPSTHSGNVLFGRAFIDSVWPTA